jgi:hypothetical protein
MSYDFLEEIVDHVLELIEPRLLFSRGVSVIAQPRSWRRSKSLAELTVEAGNVVESTGEHDAHNRMAATAKQSGDVTESLVIEIVPEAAAGEGSKLIGETTARQAGS